MTPFSICQLSGRRHALRLQSQVCLAQGDGILRRGVDLPPEEGAAKHMYNKVQALSSVISTIDGVDAQSVPVARVMFCIVYKAV